MGLRLSPFCVRHHGRTLFCVHLVAGNPAFAAPATPRNFAKKFDDAQLAGA
jgi:hypothetical protein